MAFTVATRRDKAPHDPAQIMRRDADVAIVDDDVFILRMRKHLGQIRDLARRAETERAFDQTDRHLRELSTEAVDLAERGVFKRADAEENLELSLVLLSTMADEARVHAWIDSLDGLEQRDVPWLLILMLIGNPGLLRMNKVSGAPKRKQQVGQTSERKHSEGCFDGEGKNRLGCLNRHASSIPNEARQRGGWCHGRVPAEGEELAG